MLHGDLAARNLLVIVAIFVFFLLLQYRTELCSDGTKRYVIKITDFGMSILTDSMPTCDVSDRTTFPSK